VVRVAGAGRAASMSTVNAQPGIFALGTPEHAYLEFDLAPGTPPVELVRAAAGLVDPLSTTGGVNLVVGFRPELWAGWPVSATASATR
jgi:porphyrinogen peroxidase